MMEGFIALGIVIMVLILGFVLPWLFISDSAAMLWARMKGGRRVYIKPAAGNMADDCFYTVAQVDPFGDLIAFKFPRSKTRQIILNEDGTGRCYGAIEWIDA